MARLYFCQYLNYCKSDFDGVKSNVGLLWFNQMIHLKHNLRNPINQTKSTEQNLYLCETKSIEPNLPNQIYKTESSKLNLPSKTFEF